MTRFVFFSLRASVPSGTTRISGVMPMRLLKSSRTRASAAGKYFMPIFMYERDEVLYMLCLDSQKCVICCQLISRGVVNSVEANVRKMTELALRFKASSVIISHNHPRGTVKPSREDDIITTNLSRALNAVGIMLDDHIIVCGDSFSSYNESGLFRSTFR